MNIYSDCGLITGYLGPALSDFDLVIAHPAISPTSEPNQGPDFKTKGTTVITGLYYTPYGQQTSNYRSFSLLYWSPSFWCLARRVPRLSRRAHPKSRPACFEPTSAEYA